MKKLRVSPALLALCAAVLLFVGAFFLGRASALGEARITVQRAAPAPDARRAARASRRRRKDGGPDPQLPRYLRPLFRRRAAAGCGGHRPDAARAAARARDRGPNGGMT